ncbi:MAG: exodeoxyribonuclease VII large subunit [Scytonema sp. PMC 1069.18]|nr:exodeoxyribonuclease VII large subunit [Scytonema sp. PMC 1069.18]MEC4885791.1 exodeoxyribonuclease VII large subunit [Scytonema sp. PMC 1070.18]
MAFNFADTLPETALSVGGLTDYIRFLLEQDEELQRVWVTGEVSSASRHRSGLFFTLQDPESKAAIRCVVWNTQLAKLVQVPAPGEQLIILGSLKVYRERGEYQLTVWQALPAGVGLQAMRYQQLRQRLQAEGFFDPQRKRALPIHPQTIAVVTSPTAAAWGDIQKTLKQRYPGIRILFSPATVQGEQAPESIVNAIRRVEKDGRAEVLILSRGGGAIEELACFNDERVVRAVACCIIPIITGIGHQRDESLVDLVADATVHTPTAAAELVVPALTELQAQHRQRAIHLCDSVRASVETAQKQLQQKRDRLRRLRLDRQMQQEAQELGWKRQQLVRSTTAQLQQAKQHIEMLRQKLGTLDPKAVLQRGYAVVRSQNGAIARSANELTVGEELLVQLNQGEVTVKVVKVKE